MAFRKDLLLISSWIKPNSKVLDLGCGNGELLRLLELDKNVNVIIKTHYKEIVNYLGSSFSNTHGIYQWANARNTLLHC